jgi:hypothetical protein
MAADRFAKRSNLINWHNYLSPFGPTHLLVRACDQTHEMIYAELFGINTHHRWHCDPSQWQIHPVADRSGETLKELSKSIYKKFKQHPLTVEITKGELARNGKLTSC